MEQLVSVILPYYNAEVYLSDTIKSVLRQTYQNWELILVNDGSTDESEKKAAGFDDPRIIRCAQANKGVSAARNLGLSKVRGSFLCFLDADDILPPEALSSRVKILEQNESIDFVDGQVIYTDASMVPSGKVYQPTFRGKPKDQLLQLNEQCLFGNTWMIRIRDNVVYRFDESLTHAEDLFFYLSICQQSEGLYDYVDTPILYYRRTGLTAMADLDGLGKGYEGLILKIKDFNMATRAQLMRLKLKVTKIMFLSHLIDGRNPLKAAHVILKYIAL